MRRPALAAAALAALLAGCSASAPEQAAPTAPPTTPTPSAPACATAAPGAFPALPADFPADFPAPPGAADAVADDTDPAVVAVRFPSSLPLREATRFVVEGLPAAGYEVVGGDREPHEADIVFARGTLRGQLRIAAVDDCTTFWLVQVQRPGG